MTESAGPALKRLNEELGSQVRFVELYVREAHPGSRFPQPKASEQKMDHARAYQRRDRIPWTIAVDGIEGTLHRALDPKPHSAFLVDARGHVAGRILWANDIRALRRGLLELAEGRPVGDVETKAVPLMRGLGSIYDVLGDAGGYARSDLAREVPPMFALARIASLFRPLPPLGRGVAAMASVGAIVGLGVFGARTLIRRLA